jgi:hypothetical protein
MGKVAEPLSKKQEQVLIALLAEPTIASAARRLGLTERAVYRHLSDPVFKTAYRQARRTSFDAVIGGLAAIASIAVTALASTIKSKDANVRVRSAKVILDKAFAAIGMSDLNEKLNSIREAMEKADAERGQHGSRSGQTVPESSGPCGSGASDHREVEDGPDDPIHRDGLETGPVADGVPSDSVEAGIPPLFSPSGQVDSDGQSRDDGSDPLREQ